MEKIKNQLDLKVRIDFLDTKQEQQELELREEFKKLFEQIKPANLLKTAVKDVFKSPEVKKDLVNGGLGLLTGIAARGLLMGTAGGPVKMLLGRLLQSTVAATVASKAEPVKEKLLKVFRDLMNKKEKPTE